MSSLYQRTVFNQTTTVAVLLVVGVDCIKELFLIKPQRVHVAVHRCEHCIKELFLIKPQLICGASMTYDYCIKELFLIKPKKKKKRNFLLKVIRAKKRDLNRL